MTANAAAVPSPSEQAATAAAAEKIAALERASAEQRGWLEAKQGEIAGLQTALNAARAETAQAQQSAAHAHAQAQQAAAMAAAPRDISQRRGLGATGGSGDLAVLGGGGAVYGNKKNEDVGLDIEGAIITGGNADGAFTPLLGRLKSMGASVPALRSPRVLRVAGFLDRASVHLQRRPMVRLGLLLYVVFVHLLWLLF